MEGLNSNKVLTDKKNPTVDLNTFGFKLSDKKYCKELFKILETLINSGDKIIRVERFHQNNAHDILRKISTSSNAISVEEEQDVNFEKGDNGEIYPSNGGYIPTLVTIKNKTKLKAILKNAKKEVEDIYKKGVSSFLLKNKELEWRCPNHKHGKWLGSYDSPKEIMELLDRFSNGGYKECRWCCGKNIFSISNNGKIKFSIINKDKKT